MPRPFTPLVQNALVAEPRSVKIGALVGENGRWYAFGKMTVDLYESHLRCHLPCHCHCLPPTDAYISVHRQLKRRWISLNDPQAKDLADVLKLVRAGYSFETRLDPHGAG